MNHQDTKTPRDLWIHLEGSYKPEFQTAGGFGGPSRRRSMNAIRPQPGRLWGLLSHAARVMLSGERSMRKSTPASWCLGVWVVLSRPLYPAGGLV